MGRFNRLELFGFLWALFNFSYHIFFDKPLNLFCGALLITIIFYWHPDAQETGPTD